MDQVQIDNELIIGLREDIMSLNDEVTALREANKNLRNNQRVARTVIRNLRDKLNELQNTAADNDAQFQSFCQENIDEFVGEVATVPEGGLPEGTNAVELSV